MEPPDRPAPHFGPGTGSRDGLGSGSGSGSGIGEASPTFEARPSHGLERARPFSHLSAARRKRAWRPRSALARPFHVRKGKLVPRYGRAESTTHQAGTRCPDSRFQAGSYIPLPSLSSTRLVIRHQPAKSPEKIRPIMRTVRCSRPSAAARLLPSPDVVLGRSRPARAMGKAVG